MALALQSGDASHLQFVAAEQIILAAARAVGASHAAHKQKGTPTVTMTARKLPFVANQ